MIFDFTTLVLKLNLIASLHNLWLGRTCVRCVMGPRVSLLPAASLDPTLRCGQHVSRQWHALMITDGGQGYTLIAPRPLPTEPQGTE